MKRTKICCALALAITMTSMAVPTFANAKTSTPSPKPAFADSQLVIKFKKQATESDKKRVLNKEGGRLLSALNALGAQLVGVQAGKVSKALEAFKRDPSVAYAEPDYIVKASALPNDPYFGYDWWQNTASDADIDAPEAWNLAKGDGVKIAILDTGVDSDHKDLKNKIVARANFTKSIFTDDMFGHGTHVAGIAAAIPNNGIGIAGTGYNASILSAKVLGDDGSGTASALAKGIIWAADNGANVINMSLGDTADSKVVKDAVDYAWSKGAVLVAAAGNSSSAVPEYPAYYDKVIAVGSSSQAKELSTFSTYGSWVDIAAPGENIFSTLPNHLYFQFLMGGFNYGYENGSSMSVPEVSGVAALVWSANQNLMTTKNNTRVRSIVVDSAERNVPVYQHFAIPLLNAYNAVTAAMH